MKSVKRYGAFGKTASHNTNPKTIIGISGFSCLMYQTKKALMAIGIMAKNRFHVRYISEKRCSDTALPILSATANIVRMVTVRNVVCFKICMDL
jgi:hypothetical protein